MAGFAHPYVKFPKRPISFAVATDEFPWNVLGLCKSYGWPTGLTGGGKIGILELGGGYIPSDIAKFCNRNKIPLPHITNVSVDHGAINSPGLSDADAEVTLDIEIAIASYYAATQKPANVVMLWANNDIGGLARGIPVASAAVCDVLSISWGDFESAFGITAAVAVENAAITATNAGVAIFAASGDSSSDDGDPSSSPTVDIPGSCPHIIGCGGSMRPRNSNQQTNPERVWGTGQADGEGSGGGISTFFAIPSWQSGKIPGAPNATGRCAPDVAANADPNTGYHIVLHGSDIVVGGTSAAAPLYAGLVAAFGKKLGFIGQTLWNNPDIWRNPIPGSNGFTQPPCPGLATGLGTPYGSKLAELFNAK